MNLASELLVFDYFPNFTSMQINSRKVQMIGKEGHRSSMRRMEISVEKTLIGWLIEEIRHRSFPRFCLIVLFSSCMVSLYY